jgi:3-oxoacyl-[acyl-carrier protein] reductase
MKMPRLSGKKALVTGGSRGIGSGIARSLAKHGADVGFTYKSRADAAATVVQDIEAFGSKGVSRQADSSGPEALTTAIDDIAVDLGGLDILVSSAGALMFKPIDEFTLDDFEKIVTLDLRAAFVG